ncbi:MAG: YdiU family protein [Gammaproteobacteria bacterium]|nr:YdiU family protein [Gammaproteobacteria bacterium]
MTTVHSRRPEPVSGLENSYARLPGNFYARVDPTPVWKPRLLRLNRPLAEQLGLDPEALASDEGVTVLSGNRIAAGSEPLAMAYAGHQFGGFVPSLGDGRAVLLGEIVDARSVRRDLHLKGAGRTPFSRGGDGRAPLGPVMREYVISEAMAAFGIPTTRALAIIETGERVFRERVEPGAILARVAASHVRVGTFEYFHRRGDRDSVRTLADYVIQRHYPHCAGSDNRYRALLDEVIARQADLIARWMLVGFIHGVMNTDNMAVSGETIDYGPCAFMDVYAADTVYSSIDYGGRYAYNQQPRIAYWNLAQLAECLLPLLDPNKAASSVREALDAFAARFEAAFHAGLRAKIGLDGERDADTDLAFDLLHRMSRQDADFTNTFRALCDVAVEGPVDDREVRRQFADPTVFDEWAVQWRKRLSEESRGDRARHAAMRAVNPAFIPRNHRVQEAINAATDGDGNLQPLEDLLTVIGSPFDDHPGLTQYALPPKPEEAVMQTFCGT